MMGSLMAAMTHVSDERRARQDARAGTRTDRCRANLQRDLPNWAQLIDCHYAIDSARNGPIYDCSPAFVDSKVRWRPVPAKGQATRRWQAAKWRHALAIALPPMNREREHQRPIQLRSTRECELASGANAIA